jgi:hypothetical protein
MAWLQRNAWWGLIAMAAIIVLFGVTDVISGVAADPLIPLGLTGLTLAQLEAESANAYRLLDFVARAGGANLVVIGLLMMGILVFAFRRGELWAWWAMWTLPAWAASAFMLNLAYGVAPGQAPPPPMISGPIFAVVAAAILLVSRPGRAPRRA